MSTPHYSGTPFADHALAAAAFPTGDRAELDKIVATTVENQVRLIVSLLQVPGVGGELAAPLARALVNDPAAQQALLEFFMSKLPQRKQTVVHQHTHEFEPTHWRWERIPKFVQRTRYIMVRARVIIGAVLGFALSLFTMLLIKPGAFTVNGPNFQQVFSDAISHPAFAALVIVCSTVIGAMCGAFVRKEETYDEEVGVEWRPLLATGTVTNDANDSTEILPTSIRTGV